MNRRRTLIIAAIIVGVGIVATVLWLLLRRPPASPGSGGTPTPPAPTPGQLIDLTPPPVTEPAPQQTGVLALARSWAERFTSWSNEDGFSNFEILIPQSTPPVQSFLNSYRASLATQYPPVNGYHGVTGRALGPQLTAFDSAAGQAEVAVTMQLEEGDSASTTLRNRVLELRLVQSGEAWLVDFVKWQN